MLISWASTPAPWHQRVLVLLAVCLAFAADAVRAQALTEALPSRATADVGAPALQPAAGAPPSLFELPTLDGATQALEDARGRVVVVHVFATWCEPCREELPALSRFALRHRDTVRVLAVDVGEVDARVRSFFETLPVSFPILLDRDRSMMRAWKVPALPTTFVLNAELQLRYRAVGDVAWDEMEPGRLIADLAVVPQPALPPQDPSASAGTAIAAPRAPTL